MKIVKYIINELGVPILFGREIVHSDVVFNSVSAGYAIIYYDDTSAQFVVKCYGESSSLQKKSSNKDFLLIQNYLNQFLVNK